MAVPPFVTVTATPPVATTLLADAVTTVLLVVAVGLLAVGLGARWLWAGSGVAWDVLTASVRGDGGGGGEILSSERSGRDPPEATARARRQPDPDERRAALVRLVRGFVLVTLGLTALLFAVLGL